MALDIKKFSTSEDILNSEGTILGLHTNKEEDQLYLSSYLTDKSGTVYCRTDTEKIKDYFNDKMKLKALYLASDDPFVWHVSQHKAVYYPKEDFEELIACGDRLFSENPDGMRNDRLARLWAR